LNKLSYCKKIEELYLSDNNIGISEMTALVPFLRDTKNLKKLSMSNCGLSDKTAESFCGLLMLNSSA